MSPDVGRKLHVNLVAIENCTSCSYMIYNLEKNDFTTVFSHPRYTGPDMLPSTLPGWLPGTLSGINPAI